MEEERRSSYPQSARNRLIKIIWTILPKLFVIFMAVVIVGIGFGIKSKSKRIKAERMESLRMDRPPVNVVALEVSARAVRDRLNLPGVVEPWVELMLLAEVRGRVVEVAVREGDFVEKGDLIVRLDSRDYKNALASAKASFEIAVKAYRRAKNLYSKELISEVERDNARANMETLKSAMDNARLQLERSDIRSPISGIVNRLDADEGLLLGFSDPVAVILDISRVKISVGIPESDVDSVRKLESFDVTIDALNGRVVRGRKVFISRAPDTLARLYKLQIGVDNGSGEILPGMFVRANIVKREISGGISVPLYAVISNSIERYVYIEKNGVAHVRMVELGILEGWLIQIARGLEPGDRVIVVGQRSLEEGSKVNVTRTITDPEELFR
jgi:membrane fusion protein (multidrug efflux system)